MNRLTLLAISALAAVAAEVPPKSAGLDALSAKDMPEAHRFPDMPSELVAIRGRRAYRHAGPFDAFLPFSLYLSYAPDGQTLLALDRFGAAAENDVAKPAVGGDVVRLWEVASGREVRRFSLPGARWFGYFRECNAVWILAQDKDGWTWRAFDRDDGRVCGALSGTGYPPGWFIASPDGRLVFVSGYRNRPTIRDMRSGRVVARLPNEDDPEQFRLGGAAFSRDGSRLVATLVSGGRRAYDGSTRLAVFDSASGLEVDGSDYHWHGMSPLAVAPDGGSVLMSRTWMNNSDLRFWDFRSRTWTGIAIPAYASNTAISPHGNLVVSAGRAYDAKTGRKVFLLGEFGMNAPVVFSPDGKRLAQSSYDGDIAEYDATTGDRLTPASPTREFFAVSPDGSRLLFGEGDRWYPYDGRPRLLVTETNTDRTTWTATADLGESFHDAACLGAVVACRTAGRLTFRDLDSGKRRGEADSRSHFALTATPSGARLLVGDYLPQTEPASHIPERNRVRFNVLDGATRGHVGRPVQTSYQVWCRSPPLSCICADGTVFALVEERGLELFNTKRGRSFALIPYRAGMHRAFALSSDGGRACCGTELYDTGDEERFATLQGVPPATDRFTLAALSFHPDGRTLFGALANRVVRWSAKDGSVVSSWHLPGTVRKLAFTADGRYLFAGNADGKVFVFRL